MGNIVLLFLIFKEWKWCLEYWINKEEFILLVVGFVLSKILNILERLKGIGYYYENICIGFEVRILIMFLREFGFGLCVIFSFNLLYYY